ncbi:hypothetical protein EYF80_040656 [Liparis tanakae]|uniref:Uncharacterized protein n=1 Tax=Liparis tanakae TaxID=230148 RepID=A0A4Z2G6F6_9TELE|nr:hypothetical protein EYF80_040656 [Liparis tanakae]
MKTIIPARRQRDLPSGRIRQHRKYIHVPLQSGVGLHMSQILQREPHAGRPERLWAVHKPPAPPGHGSSSPLSPMEAIKPFIFYV